MQPCMNDVIPTARSLDSTMSHSLSSSYRAQAPLASTNGDIHLLVKGSGATMQLDMDMHDDSVGGGSLDSTRTVSTSSKSESPATMSRSLSSSHYGPPPSVTTKGDIRPSPLATTNGGVIRPLVMASGAVKQLDMHDVNPGARSLNSTTTNSLKLSTSSRSESPTNMKRCFSSSSHRAAATTKGDILVKASDESRNFFLTQPDMHDVSPSARSLNSTKLKLSTSSRSESPTATISRSQSSSHSLQPPPACTKYDIRRMVKAGGGTLSLEELRFVQKLGSGDIGSVYLVELKCAEGCMLAAKVMDKEELMSRDKENRARVELEILEMLDHPFLPSLYGSLDVDRWSCLLTEYCPGGDLHILRQRQPERRFDEAAVRFYASEVIVALEYLHMMGVIYRDLKPENVLVRSDGHIMLTDFDLCLRCNDSTSPKLIQGQDLAISSPLMRAKGSLSSCILPSCMKPKFFCFHPKRKRRPRPNNRPPFDIVAEPVEARSMSFVGTHEYLAPEVVSGEGHGNAVDWWTLGIFVYELFYGVTPFRGSDNEFTLTSILARGLQFPKEPESSAAMKDLITKLLIKDPAKRIGSMKGAPSIKHHPFFDGVNWALLRGASPPYVPKPVSFQDFVAQNDHCDDHIDYY